jgi:hypothetical protein
MFKKVMPYLQQTLQCNAAAVVKTWMIGGDENTATCKPTAKFKSTQPSQVVTKY